MPLSKTLWHGHPLCQVACSCHSTQEWSWSLSAIDKDLFASPPKKKQLQYVTAPHSFDQLRLSFETSKTKNVRSQKWKKLPSPFRATREKMVEFSIEYKLFASFFATSINIIFHQKNYYQKIPENLPKNNKSSPIEFQASAFFQYLPVHQRSVARLHFLSPGTMRRRSPWLLEKGISQSSENGTSAAKGLRKSAFFFDGEDEFWEGQGLRSPKNLRNFCPSTTKDRQTIEIQNLSMLIIYKRDLPYLDSSSWLWLTMH